MVDIARCAEVGALSKIITNMKKQPHVCSVPKTSTRLCSTGCSIIFCDFF